MKYFSLVWSGLWRKPARSWLTLLSILIAFLLFGLLQGVNSAFDLIIERQKLDRLFVDPRFPGPLPRAYLSQIEQIPGITQMTEVSFLGGYIQEPAKSALLIATQPDRWLAIRPEYQIPREQIDAAVNLRTGVIVTSWLAEYHDWHIGDQFTMRTQMAKKDGSTDWTFDVVGIMNDPAISGVNAVFLGNWDYFDEARSTNNGNVNRFLLRIADAGQAEKIAGLIDAQFRNSRAETRTQNEVESAQAQLATIGDVNFFTRTIMGAVFFTLLLLTASTMMESIRERTSELAVLKTLGFTDTKVLWLVLSEALLLCLLAAMIGLAVAAMIFPVMGRFVGTTRLPWVVVYLGAVAAFIVALVSAAVPAWRAKRLNIVEALTVR